MSLIEIRSNVFSKFCGLTNLHERMKCIGKLLSNVLNGRFLMDVFAEAQLYQSNEPAIPNVCVEHQVEYVRINEFLEKENVILVAHQEKSLQVQPTIAPEIQVPSIPIATASSLE